LPAAPRPRMGRGSEVTPSLSAQSPARQRKPRGCIRSLASRGFELQPWKTKSIPEGGHGSAFYQTLLEVLQPEIVQGGEQPLAPQPAFMNPLLKEKTHLPPTAAGDGGFQ